MGCGTSREEQLQARAKEYRRQLSLRRAGSGNAGGGGADRGKMNPGIKARALHVAQNGDYSMMHTPLQEAARRQRISTYSSMRKENDAAGCATTPAPLGRSGSIASIISEGESDDDDDDEGGARGGARDGDLSTTENGRRGSPVMEVLDAGEFPRGSADKGECLLPSVLRRPMGDSSTSTTGSTTRRCDNKDPYVPGFVPDLELPSANLSSSMAADEGGGSPRYLGSPGLGSPTGSILSNRSFSSQTSTRSLTRMQSRVMRSPHQSSVRLIEPEVDPKSPPRTPIDSDSHRDSVAWRKDRPRPENRYTKFSRDAGSPVTSPLTSPLPSPRTRSKSPKESPIKGSSGRSPTLRHLQELDQVHIREELLKKKASAGGSPGPKSLGQDKEEGVRSPMMPLVL